MELKLNLDEFESVLIYKSLTDEKYLTSIIDLVKPEYFKDKNIKAIFTTIKNFYVKRNTVPTITELKTYINSDDVKNSFITVLRTMSNMDKNFNETELIESTERYIKERAIYNTMLEVADDISSGKIDTSFILDKFEKSCNINLNCDIGLDMINNFDLVIKDITTDAPTISSRWKWLDDKLDGGFLENGRALYVFAGETNVGKSIFLGNVASNIASQNKTVLIITLEMSEMMYAKRLSSSITKIPIRSLRDEAATLKQQIGEISKESPGCRILIKEFPPSTVTCHQLQSFIKNLISSGIEIHAVVVDYVNLIKSNIGTNSYERIKYATEHLRALTYTFNCPFITATQLNRTGYNVNNPGLDTIGESIGLAATADVIIGISQDDEDREMDLIKISLMKNRFGPRAVGTTMKIDYSTLTVSEDESLNESGGSIESNIIDTLSTFSKRG